MVTSVAAGQLQAALREMRSLRDGAPAGASAPGQVPAAQGAAAEQKQPAVEAIPDIDPEMLRNAVAEIEHNIQTVARSLQFSVDKESGRTVITVIDRETEEVIRQIPPQEVLAIASRLNAAIGGVLMQAEA